MSGIVGLDIGTRMVKAVCLEGTAKHQRLTGFACKELPAGATPELVQQTVQEVLQAVYKTGGHSSDRVVVSLAAYDAAVRELTIPFTDEARVRSTAKFEAEAHVPFPIDEVVLDYVRIGQAADKTDLMICAVRKDVIGRVVEMMNGLKVDPVLIDLDASGVVNAAARSGLLPESGSVVLIDIGWTATRFVLVVDGRMRHLRTTRIGIGSTVGEVSTILDAGIEGAEKHVDTFARGGVLEESRRAAVEKALEGLTDRLRKEAKRFLAAASGGAAPQKVLVSGGASRVQAMLDTFRDAFGCDVAPLDLFADLSHSLNAQDAETAGLLGAAAVGMALKELGMDRVRMDFRQEEYAYRSGFERIRTPLTICLVLLVALFGSVGWYMQKRTDQLSTYETGLRRGITQLWTGLYPGKKVPADPVAMLESKLKEIQEGDLPTGGDKSALDTLLEVMNTFPWSADTLFQQLNVTTLLTRVRGEVVGGFPQFMVIGNAFDNSKTLRAERESVYTQTNKVIFTLKITPR